MICIPYPVIDMVRTGENIKRLREERNISVTEIQIFLGLTNPQAVYQWQKGISLPTVDHLCALSHLFELSMNDILVLKDYNAENITIKLPHTGGGSAVKNLLMLVAA